MAETLHTLKTRRSCRAYKPELIEQEKLDAIIEAGTYAATGMGRQSPIIIAVTDPDVRNQLSKLNAAVMGSDADPFYGAPELLIVLANRSMPTYIYDGSLVMGNMMNAAADLGVDKVTVGSAHLAPFQRNAALTRGCLQCLHFRGRRCGESQPREHENESQREHQPDNSLNSVFRSHRRIHICSPYIKIHVIIRIIL